MTAANLPENPGFSVLGDSISTLKGYIPDGWRCHYEGEVSIEGISTPADTWWGKVLNAFGGHLVGNASFSGSCMEGFGFPGGCSKERAAGLLGPNGETPDCVLVFMGINDYGWGGARQQVMGGSMSRSANREDLGEPYEVLETVDAASLQRFHDAYAQALANIHEIAPSAEIWCLTLCPGTTDSMPWPHFMYRERGIDLDEYNDAIRSAAAEAGAHVADVRSFNIDYHSVDDTHPSALGMTQIAAMVCSQMGLEADLSVLDSAPASARHCDKETCGGCQYNGNKPSSWVLTCGKKPE